MLSFDIKMSCIGIATPELHAAQVNYLKLWVLTLGKEPPLMSCIGIATPKLHAAQVNYLKLWILTLGKGATLIGASETMEVVVWLGEALLFALQC